MVSNKFYAVVAGIGPGTGRSVALKFAEFYPVVLLSRSPKSYEDVVDQIKEKGGKALGLSTDAADETALATAFESVQKDSDFKDLQLAVAVYNVRPGSRGSRKPFLELNMQDLDTSLHGNV
jgi:NAD(P)-dependent dehydrogenase (short-subunit alcohol dehydrogenase family)